MLPALPWQMGRSTYVVGRGERAYNLRVNIWSHERSIQECHERLEYGRQQLPARANARCVDECVLELGIPGYQLGLDEGSIVDTTKLGSVDLTGLWDMLDLKSLHGVDAEGGVDGS